MDSIISSFSFVSRIVSTLFPNFDHLRIPLEDIASATDSFADENLMGSRGLEKVYKGRLLQFGQEINIVVRRFHCTLGEGNREFRTEITVLSRLSHRNLVSIVGCCDERSQKIIIYKHEVHGSLDKYLSDPTLTWMQRLNVCVGAARALSYIHYEAGRSYGVIHSNISSSKILLNENWEPKVSGFGLSMFSSATQTNRHVFSHSCGTLGYVDPVYSDTGSVTQKSDVYSFGVVLFEVLCGMRAVIIEDDGRYKFLARMAAEHYEDGKLVDIIDPELRKQMDPRSLTIFSETAYHCLNRKRTERPDMEIVLKRLEEALEFQLHREINLEHSKTPAQGTSPDYIKEKNLEHLKIQLHDIVLATQKFTKNYLGSGAYGKVYQAQLYHFDSKRPLAIEGNNKDELPKKQSIVAIKRISSREDGQGEQGFYAEIDMLTSCNHPNIVSLLGFCDEGPEKIIVYEFASNGSLDGYLRNPMNTLTWTQRIKICLDIARGLNYLHTIMTGKQRIIHCDIKGDNILLYKKLEAKIADFGLSRFHPETICYTSKIAGTEGYLDPEYQKDGKLKKESDTYSFGIVLFEIVCGRFSYDKIYNVGNDNGFASFVRQCFDERTLKEMVAPKLKEEIANIFTPIRGPNQDSLDTVLEIGYKCLAETQAQRPTMKVVIEELEKALKFQRNNIKISLKDVKLATQCFSHNNLIGKGSSGDVYKGQVPQAKGDITIVAKQLDRALALGQREHEFTVLQILFEYRNENVIDILGYCDEMGEKIAVYEYASRGSLDRYLEDNCLSWMKRLEICVDVASGLEFLHGTVVKPEVVIHGDIKSSNILLNEEWKAKIANFGLSSVILEMDNCADIESGVLSKGDDIYSFGVFLIEILCGKVDLKDRDCTYTHLSTIVKHKLNEGGLECIKGKFVPESLSIYSCIAYQCILDEREKRPTASDVLVQLKKALEIQEEYEIWALKLPEDYKKIIQMSKSPEIYIGQKKKDLYTMFFNGVLLQKDKLWFSLGSKGERNEMISAREFSYKNRRLRKWQSVPKSRFPKVAEMLDISNLKIQIRIRTQLLSPDVNYGVYLIFRFCGPRKSQAKRMYVNLKYKKGKEKLHAYFATWREDEWMMIELYRFYNHKEDAVQKKKKKKNKEDTDFEVLLESFSRCYCESHAIYVEGIEFREIDNVKHGEIEKSKEVQVMKSNSQSDCEDIFKRSENNEEGGKLRLVASKMQTTNDQMFFVKKVLSETFDGELLNSRPKVQFRFEGVTELLRQQVFYIKCKIKSQMLSPNTENVCYLVFKLSEKCCGLHCPVIVRDLHDWRNKETGILYFRTPSPWNLHDTDWVPKNRKDGWMEVIVWKFHSTNVLKNDDLPLNLKLISYQGTMSGLIVRGLEFQTM